MLGLFVCSVGVECCLCKFVVIFRYAGVVVCVRVVGALVLVLVSGCVMFDVFR